MSSKAKQIHNGNNIQLETGRYKPTNHDVQGWIDIIMLKWQLEYDN